MSSPATLIDLTEHAQLAGGILERLLERTETVEQLTPSEALRFLTNMREVSALARDVARVAEQMMVSALDGARRAEIDGKVIEVRRSYKRVWDSPLLAGAVAACVLQGERIPEVDTVVEALVKAARMEWRVTALKDMGISDEAYAEKELGPPTVSIIGG